VYFTGPDAWPDWAHEALGEARGRVLDVGCGAGRFALHLQEAGHEVVAIDLSPLAVEVCRLRGVRRAAVLPVTRIGPALGSVDTVLMMGNNLGLLANTRRGRWLLRRMHRMTPEDGRIVAETLDPHRTTDPDHLAYHARNRARGRLPGQVRIRVRYRRSATPWFDYLFVSRGELADLVAGTGWRLERVVDTDGATWVAVLEKA
jgi:SAM-dependent methyltransferase